MKILVTGPDGVLGSNVVRELLSRDYEVSVMLLDASAKTPTLDGLNIQRFYGNILNPAELDTCLLYTSPSPRDSFRSRMPSSA